MAETLVILKEGSLNSIVSGLLIAIQFKGIGVDAGVVMSQEALVAFGERKFGMPPLLATHAEKIFENVKKQGLSTDPMDMLKTAKAAGVPIYACGVWTALLEVKDKLPAEIEPLELPDIIKVLAEAKRHITA